MGNNEDVLTAQEQVVTFLGACENMYSFFGEQHNCVCSTNDLSAIHITTVVYRLSLAFELILAW